MSSQELKFENLKKQIEELILKNKFLKNEIDIRDKKIVLYQNELFKFSSQLDHLMIQSKQEIDILRMIQNILIPVDLPKFQGFKISRKFIYGSQFGGDYFDLFEHEDKLKFGLMLSSATGYSISSLFLSLMLKMSHTVEAKKGLDSATFLKNINSELLEHLNLSIGQKSKINIADQELSAFYGIIDRRDLSLSFCLVGEIRGFVLTSKKILKKISTDSSGMGLDRSSKFENCRLELEPQSRLVFVSKGILEVLSLDELSDLLIKNSNDLTHDIRNEIFVRAQHKSGVDQPLRDQTVVVIDVKDKVIKLAK